MCGIAGVIRFDDYKINEGNLIRMRDSMHYRGPDDSGIYINDERSVALAHRRLSIIDLSSLGHQPMSSEDGNIRLIHNGEIYNFRELKAELKTSGHTFFSGSDTEVILKAYQEWGEKSFEKLNGMFAFCIYDRKKDLLYLVRDHAGIKPLYYSISNGRLLFSSEVRAFKVFDGNWEENKDWRIYFLTFGHLPEPFTTLKDVYALPGGSFLRLDLKTGKHALTEHTRFEFTGAITNPQDAAQGTRKFLTKAVERHYISDAPIGVFLSGGIDSSLIALVADEFQKDNLRTLSIVFNEKEYSEKSYQDIVLGRIKAHHASCLVTGRDFMDNLDNISLSMDQPTIDGVNTYFISKCAREAGLKAVLSGLGGDELFGGYPSFERIDNIWPVRESIPSSIFKAFRYSGNDKWKKLSFLSLKNPLGYYLLFRGLYTPDCVARLLDTDEKEVFRTLEKVYVEIREDISKKNLVSYLETKLYMRNQLLKDSDFMSMKHSVEVRVPFLDKELMRFVCSVKDTVKFNSGMPKHLLVKAFGDILPKEITTRKKQGFTFPFDTWMRKSGRGVFEEVLSENSINKSYSDKLFHKFENGKLHWSRVWALMVLEKA
jgi:asparagine synthase (glutamine-hydrolysing)